MIAVGAGAAALPEWRRLVRGPALTRARAATYEALVETVAHSPGTLADAARAKEARRRLAARYARAADGERARIDDALDAVAEASGVRAFSSLPVTERVRELRRRLVEADRAGGDGTLQARISAAAALAAAPFHPSGFRWTLATGELWVRTLKATGHGTRAVAR